MPTDKPVANPPLRYSVESEPPPPPSNLPAPVPDYDHSQQGAGQPTGSQSSAAQPPVAAPTQPVQVGAAPQSRPPAGAAPSQYPPQSPAPTRVASAPEPGPVESVTVRGYRGYELGPNDKVHVTVYGEPDLTGDFQISGSGRIAFPLIGEVQAAGMTAPELGERLATRLSNGYLLQPRVSVEVASYRPIFVVGQVMRPGSYPYANGMTALNAIAVAGGFMPHAIDSHAWLRRQGDLNEEEIALDGSHALEPGDVLRVDESTFWSVLGVLAPLSAAASPFTYRLQ